MPATKHFLRAVGAGATALALLAGCEPRESAKMQTGETEAVEKSLAAFKKSPTEANKRRAEGSLAKMDAEISELQVRVSKAGGERKSKIQDQLDEMRVQYAAYQTELSAAKVAATLDKAGEALTGDSPVQNNP